MHLLSLLSYCTNHKAAATQVNLSKELPLTKDVLQPIPTFISLPPIFNGC